MGEGCLTKECRIDANNALVSRISRLYEIRHCGQRPADKHSVWNINLILINKGATNDELCGFKR